MEAYEGKQLAYVQSQTACALIEMEAMKAANDVARSKGCEPKYTEKDFRDLIGTYGIHHNAVMSACQGF